VSEAIRSNVVVPIVNPYLPPEWSAHTPPVDGGDFASCPLLVLHYWAVWDRIDREMDERLAPLREDYAGRICFRSCDIDRPENQSFIKGIANIPALGCFIRGTWYKSLVGLRSEADMRRVFDTWLAAAAMPDRPPARRAGLARVVSFVGNVLRRGSAD
jgi:hypothetical protein